MRSILILLSVVLLFGTLKIFAIGAVYIGGWPLALTIICACIAIAHYIEPTGAKRVPPDLR